MKKIFMGLFILGTLGMAQQNYEVYVKNGVKISQSEADRDSKEIDKIINDNIISRFNSEGKKVIIDNSKKLYNEYMNSLMDNIVKNVPKNQQQVFKGFLNRISEIIAQNCFSLFDNMELSIKDISFLGKNKAKINMIVKYKDIEDIDVDSILDEVLKKSGITEKETEHFEKINKAKLDKFYKYFDDKLKEEIKNFDESENSSEIEIEKVNGKWQLDFDYDYFMNTIIESLKNDFNNENNIDNDN